MSASSGVNDVRPPNGYTVSSPTQSSSSASYRLDGIRSGATRFGAVVTRGLSAFVGREHELEVLDRALEEARSRLRVIDIAAEPGMGKSRLLHEFRERIVLL